MSYYDFEDHFWSPKTVCIQSKAIDKHKRHHYRKLRNAVLIIFTAMSMGLLIKILFDISNNHLDNNPINSNNLSSNCLMLKSNSELQIYCSERN